MAMSDFTTTTDETPQPSDPSPPAPEPEAEPAPAPPTDEEKVNDLVQRLHLEPTAHALDTIWEWASHHFGLSRPTESADA